VPTFNSTPPTETSSPSTLDLVPLRVKVLTDTPGCYSSNHRHSPLLQTSRLLEPLPITGLFPRMSRAVDLDSLLPLPSSLSRMVKLLTPSVPLPRSIQRLFQLSRPAPPPVPAPAAAGVNPLRPNLPVELLRTRLGFWLLWELLRLDYWLEMWIPLKDGLLGDERKPAHLSHSQWTFRNLQSNPEYKRITLLIQIQCFILES